jgi:glycosyltransferase involved in cell wall biosynthesis
MEKLSAVIMTYNEEENIARCLDSVAGIADEVLVVDSYSSDQTAEIARRKGAKVVFRAWDGFYGQRQFAFEQATYPLVLNLDADEWLSDKLKSAITFVKKSRQFDCYSMNRANSIGGHWMRYGSWYADRKVRLFDRRKIKHINYEPHDRIEPAKKATLGHLAGDIFHLSDKNISTRYDTINRHSTSAAQFLVQKGKKTNLLRLLFKPPIRFLAEYLVKLGFLDGFYGFVVALSSAHYVYLRESKLHELYRMQQNRPSVHTATSIPAPAGEKTLEKR